ncbi:MAG: hypothetical protein GY871_15590 [Actinomycetales bacterium]|nr:hypothetical protein [Actinomycetales bacterium]
MDHGPTTAMDRKADSCLFLLDGRPTAALMISTTRDLAPVMLVTGTPGDLPTIAFTTGPGILTLQGVPVIRVEE